MIILTIELIVWPSFQRIVQILPALFIMSNHLCFTKYDSNNLRQMSASDCQVFWRIDASKTGMTLAKIAILFNYRCAYLAKVEWFIFLAFGQHNYGSKGRLWRAMFWTAEGDTSHRGKWAGKKCYPKPYPNHDFL